MSLPVGSTTSHREQAVIGTVAGMPMAEQLDRTSDLMDRAIPGTLGTGHEALIDGLVLPDPDDRQVLAAAIRCHASVIVTFNERDFPADVLDSFGLEAQHPDLFVENLFLLSS